MALPNGTSPLTRDEIRRLRPGSKVKVYWEQEELMDDRPGIVLPPEDINVYPRPWLLVRIVGDAADDSLEISLADEFIEPRGRCLAVYGDGCYFWLEEIVLSEDQRIWNAVQEALAVELLFWTQGDSADTLSAAPPSAMVKRLVNIVKMERRAPRAQGDSDGRVPANTKEVVRSH